MCLHGVIGSFNHSWLAQYEAILWVAGVICELAVQRKENNRTFPTGDSQLFTENLPGADPFHIYENLSWIHDIHYRWGLPFCTPVTWAEIFMICTSIPTTTSAPLLPPTPLISLFISTSICLPIAVSFHPSTTLFHPCPALWSLIIPS